MLFYSTNGKSEPVSFRTTVLQGLAADGGLWMPSAFFPIKKPYGSLVEIAEDVAYHFSGDDVPPAELNRIVEDSINFDAPLIQLDEDLFVLELFHGPTLAFKDFGARFLARLLSYFLSGKFMTILAATSGDTGSAVASGFFGIDGIRVVLLYPSGKVSGIQEKQITTWGGNVQAIEVLGNFDDCQRLVKQAFQDRDLRKVLQISSANSINLGRLIPQCFYYIHACSQIRKEDVLFSVPSGNFGNLTSGLFAKRMGLEGLKFVAATNINDSFPRYLKTGIFESHPTRMTLSNAMDVGNPSNFARVLALYGADLQKIRQDICSESFSDPQTLSAIEEVYRRYQYVCDPHTAIAYLGAKQFQHDGSKVFLATAHPAKFPDVVKRACGVDVEMPEALRECLRKEKRSVEMTNEYERLKEFLYYAG